MLRKRRVIYSIVLIVFLIIFVVKRPPFVVGDFKYGDKLIIIDAGHGGKDPGAIGFNGNYEKDIALEISKRLGKSLEKEGYKVLLTRETDQYVDNLQRARFANEKGASLFISIHGNSTENNSKIDGVQVLHHPNKEITMDQLSNSELSQVMIDSIIKRTGASNRGVIERKDLIVLNQTTMPAIIVECGFLSNRKEETLLLTDKYQDKIAKAIRDGVEEYFAFNSQE